jgi:hypothetical protein
MTKERPCIEDAEQRPHRIDQPFEAFAAGCGKLRSSEQHGSFGCSAPSRVATNPVLDNRDE